MKFSSADQEKYKHNFQGSWFLALGFPKDVTQFYGTSWGEAFSLEFSLKSMFSTPHLDLFYKIIHWKQIFIVLTTYQYLNASVMLPYLCPLNNFSFTVPGFTFAFHFSTKTQQYLNDAWNIKDGALKKSIIVHIIQWWSSTSDTIFESNNNIFIYLKTKNKQIISDSSYSLLHVPLKLINKYESKLNLNL